LAAGEVDADSAYLTRWNQDKEAVDFVIGAFRDVESHD